MSYKNCNKPFVNCCNVQPTELLSYNDKVTSLYFYYISCSFMRTYHSQLLDPTFMAMYYITITVLVCMVQTLLFHAVFLPAAIQNQMIFSQFTMMKMFLSAVTAGEAIHDHVQNCCICILCITLYADRQALSYQGLQPSLFQLLYIKHCLV